MTRARPVVYQADARAWLQAESRRERRPVLLGSVSSDVLDALADAGYGWVWLRHVWEESAASRDENRRRASVLEELQEKLSDLAVHDVRGWPYAIVGYRVAAALGGDEGLEMLREELAARGLGVILEVYPAHIAEDHPWVSEHPEYLVHGSEPRATADPKAYHHASPDRILARARMGTQVLEDTVQLNYRHRGLRQAMIEELLEVLSKCDGLYLGDPTGTDPQRLLGGWGDGSAPRDGSLPVEEPFWDEALPQLREAAPGAMCIFGGAPETLPASAVSDGWIRDERLRDHLLFGDAEGLRWHIEARAAKGGRHLNFLDWIGETPAAAVAPPDRLAAAAIVAAFAPGGVLLADGQVQGHRLGLDPRLFRKAPEDDDRDVWAFYQALLELLGRPEIVRGEASLPPVRAAWPENLSWSQFVAFLHRGRAAGELLLVAVNFGPRQAQCFVDLSEIEPAGRDWTFQDLLSLAVYPRGGDDLKERGLYLDLAPWDYHVFEIVGR